MSIKSNPRITFECLSFDKSNSCVFGDDPTNFALILKANNLLFSKDSEIKNENLNSYISDKQKNLHVTITKLPGLSTLDYTSVFYIKCEIKNEGEYLNFFDKFRINLINYLIKVNFEKIYIIKDEMSSLLLTDLYPKINKIENLLRSYIIKHFSIAEGVSSWFTQVLDGDTLFKVNQRKFNENIFSSLSIDDKNKNDYIVDTRLYLTDFEDLGNIIYANSYGNFKAIDLINKIKNSNDLTTLQSSVQNNIDRYFGNFKDVGFQQKWEFLKSIRHKVAHNGLISLSEKEEAVKHLDELTTFIEEKDCEKAEADPYPEEDIEKREYINLSEYQYINIDRNEMFKELANYQKWCQDIDRDFMGLKNFLHNRLGGRGFHIGNAWSLLEDIEKEGYIKITMWKDPKNIYPDQKAIEVIKTLPVYSA